MPSEFSSTIQSWRERAAEHTRRMAEDPEYREEQKRRDAEIEAADQARRAEEERKYHEQRKHSRRVSADVPPRVWPLLDTLRETEALAAVRAFVASDATFLVLSGGIGCGKTVAACVALDVSGGRFIKAPGVTRAKFNDEAWQVLLDAAVLVIDDIGTESLDEKGWAAGAFAELFDRRYDFQAKTILTTNLDAAAFKARYCEQDGGRFLSRLREVGDFVSVAQASLRAVRAAP